MQRRLSNMPRTSYDRKKLSSSELLVKLICAVTLLFYLYCVLNMTLIDRTVGMRRHVLRPLWEFRSMMQSRNYSYWSGQIGGNLVMLFPLGFLLPTISDKFRSLTLTTMTGFAFSGFIEFTQYYTGRGLFESDDIIHNTIGAFAGCVMYLFINDKIMYSESDNYS